MKNNGLLSGILTIVLGILLIVYKSSALQWAITLAAIVLVVFGILAIIGGNMIAGIIEICLGVGASILGWTLVQMCVVIFAIVLLAKGITTLIGGLQIHGVKLGKKIFLIISPCVLIAAAVLILLNINQSIDLYFIISGVILIVDGVFYCISELYK